MTDDTTQAVTPEVQATEGQQAEPIQPKEQATVTAAVWTPESAEAEIKALRAEAAKWRKEKQAEVKAREAAEAAALAEQGNFKALYEKATPKIAEYDTLKERYEALISQVQAANERRIAAIPESMRTLVPEYDDPQRLAAWLDANAAVFTKQPAPSLDGRAGGSTAGAGVTDDEIKQLAARWRVQPEHIDREAAAKYLRGK